MSDVIKQCTKVSKQMHMSSIIPPFYIGATIHILSPTPLQNSKGTPSAGRRPKYTGVGSKILRFLTEIAVYRGNGT